MHPASVRMLVEALCKLRPVAKAALDFRTALRDPNNECLVEHEALLNAVDSWQGLEIACAEVERTGRGYPPANEAAEEAVCELCDGEGRVKVYEGTCSKCSPRCDFIGYAPCSCAKEA